MDAVPLRPLGERRLAALLEALTGKVEGWLRRWALDGSTVSIRSVVCSTEFLDTPLAGGASGRAGVSITGADVDVFGAWLAQAPRTGGQRMPARLADAAIDDLRAYLVGGASSPVARPDNPAERHWFAFVATLEAGFELRLVVDRALIYRMAPLRQPAKPSLTPQKEAAAGSFVTCTFSLDLGAVPVADVVGLAPGDVLVGQATLEALLACRVGERTTPHTFRLIRHGRQLAAMAYA